MKTVTATAAIDTGSYQPDSPVSGKNEKVISGTPLNNFGGEDFGDITLTDALTHSVNTVWAEVGVKLGEPRCGVHGAVRLRQKTRRWTTRTTRWCRAAPTARARISR